MDGVESIDLYGGDTDPVRQLLSIGEVTCDDTNSEWPDYPASYGLTQQHVGALIRMACDAELHEGDSNSSTIWAPVHAWRALGQLRAEESVQPLLAILKARDIDDTIDLEFPIIFGMIGAAAIPSIASFVSDRANSPDAVATALSGLRAIAVQHPERRGECIGILVRELEPRPDTSPTINGFVVSALLDLRAVESIDAIRDAFRRNDIDISIAGDVEDVEIELGLKEKRATPPPRYMSGDWASSRWDDWHAPDVDEPPQPKKIGRNEPCPCGSGKKYKKCCLQ
jgi:SEC-C motif